MRSEPPSRAAAIISLVIVVGFFGVLMTLLAVERVWDERATTLINVVLGALTAGFVQVVNYWLGSSAGSKRSGDAVRAIAERQAVTADDLNARELRRVQGS